MSTRICVSLGNTAAYDSVTSEIHYRNHILLRWISLVYLFYICVLTIYTWGHEFILMVVNIYHCEMQLINNIFILCHLSVLHNVYETVHLTPPVCLLSNSWALHHILMKFCIEDWYKIFSQNMNFVCTNQ